MAPMDEILRVRMTTADLRVLRRAAKKRRTSVSALVREMAMRAAESILAEQVQPAAA